MTGYEHYQKAEQLIQEANEATKQLAYLSDIDNKKVHRLLAQAQVHAILACVPSYNL